MLDFIDCMRTGSSILTSVSDSPLHCISCLLGLASDRFYIGLDDRAREGTFTWTDGSRVSYTRWHSGEPNNVGIGGEDCVQMRIDSRSWNDIPCRDQLPYVCEIEFLPDTCPANLWSTPIIKLLGSQRKGEKEIQTGLYNANLIRRHSKPNLKTDFLVSYCIVKWRKKIIFANFLFCSPYDIEKHLFSFCILFCELPMLILFPRLSWI